MLAVVGNTDSDPVLKDTSDRVDCTVGTSWVVASREDKDLTMLPGL